MRSPSCPSPCPRRSAARRPAAASRLRPMSPRLHEELQGREAPGCGARDAGVWGARRRGVGREAPGMGRGAPGMGRGAPGHGARGARAWGAGRRAWGARSAEAWVDGAALPSCTRRQLDGLRPSRVHALATVAAERPPRAPHSLHRLGHCRQHRHEREERRHEPACRRRASARRPRRVGPFAIGRRPASIACAIVALAAGPATPVPPVACSPADVSPTPASLRPVPSA